MHVVDETRRPIKLDLLVAPDQDPQQAIEAGKMINMGMGHEHVFETLNFPRRERADVAEIEQIARRSNIVST